MRMKLLKMLQLIDQLERKCRDLEIREDEDFAEIKALVAEALAYYPETPFPTYVVNQGTPCMPGPGYPPPPIMAEDRLNQYVGGPAGKESED